MALTVSVLATRFNDLRNFGGDGWSQINLKLAPKQPGQNLTKYESILVYVELMIPFTFNGHDLVSVVEGNDMSSCARTVADLDELGPTLKDMRERAFDMAVKVAAKDIASIMKEKRSTVSNRKILKKVRATLKRFDAWGTGIDLSSSY